MYYFTVQVSTVKNTWSGKIKRVLVSETRHKTPEAMLAEASKWDMSKYSVVTMEPEHWVDTRPPRVDESIDYDKDDWRDDGMPF